MPPDSKDTSDLILESAGRGNGRPVRKRQRLAALYALLFVLYIGYLPFKSALTQYPASRQSDFIPANVAFDWDKVRATHTSYTR